MSRKSKSKDQTKDLNIPFTLTQGDLLQEALAVTFAKDQTQALNIPVKVPLGGGRYADLTKWNGSKRVDLRFWKTDTIPTNVGVSLSLPQWKVLYSAMQMVDDFFVLFLLAICYLFFNIRILITPLIILKLFFTSGVWWGPCCSSI
jgi:hypothetical protein